MCSRSSGTSHCSQNPIEWHPIRCKSAFRAQCPKSEPVKNSLVPLGESTKRDGGLDQRVYLKAPPTLDGGNPLRLPFFVDVDPNYIGELWWVQRDWGFEIKHYCPFGCMIAGLIASNAHVGREPAQVNDRAPPNGHVKKVKHLKNQVLPTSRL